MEHSNAIPYKSFNIFVKGGKYAVGGKHNVEFDDCSLENLTSGVDEAEMRLWNKEQGNEIVYVDLRNGEEVTEERYIEHLNRYQTEPDDNFTDEEFIVPTVFFATEEKAKEFIDWCVDTLDKKNDERKTAKKDDYER